MEQVHFHGKIRVICKGAQRIDGGMDDDAGYKTSAAVKYRDKQETHCDRKDDLHRLFTRSMPLPLTRLIICPMPKVTLEMTTADLMLSFAIATNRSPREIISSKKPTQSMHTIRQAVSAGE